MQRQESEQGEEEEEQIAQTKPDQGALQIQLQVAEATAEKEEENPQTMMTVGQPGDQYERVADRVADQVVNMPQPLSGNGTAVSSRVTPISIQRACPECEDKLQRQPVEADEDVVHGLDMMGR